jgi:hypothetical protein
MRLQFCKQEDLGLVPSKNQATAHSSMRRLQVIGPGLALPSQRRQTSVEGYSLAVVGWAQTHIRQAASTLDCLMVQ